ncbi:hypothetical protein HD806DRAFT_536687 [Xylariaceae sp. AK1471]|nr:hypothetical protein HD806DRAFT_536687 [Xylariaceae sp. AK1471]
MKFIAIITAFITTSLAASTSLDARHGAQCTPPSYACKADNSGWLVCNVDGTYLDGGVCPPKTTCKPINNLPYCV